MPKRGTLRTHKTKAQIECFDGVSWHVIDIRRFGSEIFNAEDLEKAVARTELTIKLVTYNDDAERTSAIIDAARDAARTMVTVAMMLQEKRSPEISLFSEDFFEGTKELVVDTEGHATDD